MKPISIGIFYRAPNVNTFLETFFNDLKHIDLNKNEVYFCGDFNVNLLLNDKFILNIFQIFSLIEIIQEPTHVTTNTFSLLDHILTNAGWKISQKRLINVVLSDHQLSYCARKMLRTQANMHNLSWVWSFKNLSLNIW